MSVYVNVNELLAYLYNKQDERVDVALEIATFPTADVAHVVHGRWVDAAGGRTICNHCGEYPLYDYFGRQKFSNYCPNCGANMMGGDAT